MTDLTNTINTNTQKKSSVFLLKTATDYSVVNHYASKNLINQLSRQGYDVFYDCIVAMGSNFMSAFDPSMVKQLAESAIPEISTWLRN